MHCIHFHIHERRKFNFPHEYFDPIIQFYVYGSKNIFPVLRDALFAGPCWMQHLAGIFVTEIRLKEERKTEKLLKIFERKVSFADFRVGHKISQFAISLRPGNSNMQVSDAFFQFFLELKIDCMLSDHLKFFYRK